MKNQTHLTFAVALMNIFLSTFIHDTIELWFYFLLSYPLGFLSLVPNYLDMNLGFSPKFERINLSQRFTLTQYRHPLSHSPLTVLYFLPLIYITEGSDFSVLIWLALISWISHLILDAFSAPGIPLGKTSIFSNHPVKHYVWKEFSNGRYFSLSKWNKNENRTNSFFFRGGLFLIALNLSSLILITLEGII
ncbi:hypothetical protein [Candidatus Hodarchaeum mangrovi]